MDNDMEKVISKDGTEICFSKSGEGPPLLFVHGMTADHKSWAAISNRLEQHFTVCAMDRRGRGASGDASEYSLKHEVEDIIAIIESLEKPVHLIGHSYGGLCALEAALLTDKTGKLILYEPAIYGSNYPFPHDASERIRDLVNQDQLEAAMELFLKDIVEMPEHELTMYKQTPLWKARIQHSATIPREIEAEQNYRFDKYRFSGLKTATMLLLGSESPIFSHEGTYLLHSVLPNSKVVMLQGEQHIAHHTNPQLLAEKILEFLNEQ